MMVHLRKYLPLLSVALLLAANGCSGQRLSTVQGKVTLQNGTPVQGATVVFEDAATHVSASGITGPDGSYSLMTLKPGDGVPPGTYVVAVHNPQAEDSSQGELPPVFHRRYHSPSTSGLECTVGTGSTSYNIKLDPP